MSYPIENQIISGLPVLSLTAARYIVAHESGNPKNTGPDSLEKEINFMKNNYRNAFTSHWVGGGGRIVQLAPVGRLQYGCGPKGNPYSYAQVELARTNDPETFKKDYAAYVWLLRYLAEQAGIPKIFDEGKAATKGIKSHDWIRKELGGTTHTDPFGYLASFGITKAQFKHDVENGVPVYSAASLKEKEEEETMKEEIAKLQKQVDALEKQLNNNTQKESPWAVESKDWYRATKNGYFKGYPRRYLLREDAAKVVNKIVDNVRKYIVQPVIDRLDKLEKKIDELLVKLNEDKK